MNRIALVTGANKGIGLEIARGLGKLGITVVAGARDAERGEKAVRELRNGGADAHLVQIDTTDDASVARAAAHLDETFGRLDILVNNAGVKYEFHPAPPSQASLDVVRRTYATNVFGTMAVTLAMLPLLRRSDAGRLVNLSSGLASMTLAGVAGSTHAQKCMLSYNTSKAAVNSMTVQFANELASTPIKVNAVDPGYTNTAMTHHDGARTAEQAARTVIIYATLPDDGPSGGYFDESGPLPW
ncbi:SDR family oxidoreductase [Amycolatopsis sp.]|uniref:SDR family oxidoreductase n=1 Tax=Amycolatopsis sp. TaxID=37632 RepID=UPI002BB465ED|nr:SDR family oxidoreductase [Amycolatopsis sp.]HVV08373.1 SDR family oxidoreductase [Amycolatopsis sp.]